MSLEWMNQNSGVLSFVVSLLAVLMAIIIPISIAKSQNKIALYEERLKIYIELDFIRGFCKSLEELNAYKQYEKDSINLKQYLFSVWVICLRTEYSDAWNVRFESNPCKGEILFIGNKKDMERICEMHLNEQFSNLKRSKYVFDETIESDIKELTEEYYSIITDINKSVFYGWDHEKIIDIDSFLNKNKIFQNGKSLKRISKMIKL